MADVKLNTLPQSTSPTSTQDLLLFDESTNAGQRINYNTLADVILAKLTSKTYTVGGGTQTLISAIDALNSKLFKQLGANLSDEAFNALTADGLYVGYIPTTSCPCKQQWAYINVKSLSANANDVMQEVIGITSAITCTRMKNNGTWGGWVLAPTRAEVDALNSKIVSQDLGMSETLPAHIPNGLVGFGISSSVTVDGNSMPVGTRFFGYVAAGIGHFVGVYNGNTLYMIRKDSNGWSCIVTK